MDPRFGAFNVTTGVVACVSLWMLVARLRGVVESNWPMFYYFGVVLYTTAYTEIFDPAWVYAGVICTLLLRFEFMGGGFLKVIRAIDVLVLCYILYSAVYVLLL